jgi:hypothetical protein
VGAPPHRLQRDQSVLSVFSPTHLSRRTAPASLPPLRAREEPSGVHKFPQMHLPHRQTLPAFATPLNRRLGLTLVLGAPSRKRGALPGARHDQIPMRLATPNRPPTQNVAHVEIPPVSRKGSPQRLRSPRKFQRTATVEIAAGTSRPARKRETKKCNTVPVPEADTSLRSKSTVSRPPAGRTTRKPKSEQEPNPPNGHLKPLTPDSKSAGLPPRLQRYNDFRAIPGDA